MRSFDVEADQDAVSVVLCCAVDAASRQVWTPYIYRWGLLPFIQPFHIFGDTFGDTPELDVTTGGSELG